MAANNYTTEFQIRSIEQRLTVLSSASQIEGLSEDQLLSNLESIHENHIQLSNLLDKDKNKLVSIAKRLCILSSAINVTGLSKNQLLSTQNTIHDNHVQLSNLLHEDKIQSAKIKMGAAL